jgi:pimeloyl-ACP methyl ester carboxylesterase
MKKTLLFMFIWVLGANVSAQIPEKMSYQSVIRNVNNKLVTNQTVSIQISILQGSANGLTVYSEIQSAKTNTNGLITIEIGSGKTIDGDISNINWSKGPYFLKTEIDPDGGINYSITGTCQLLSVPYALHAKTADSISGKINEKDPQFNSSVAKGITKADTTNWNNKQNKLKAGSGISINQNVISVTCDSIVLDNREICDGQSINHSSGVVSIDTILGCTSFIDCKGVKEIELTVPLSDKTTNDGIAFYNSKKIFISGKAWSKGAVNGIKTQTVPVPANAAYFRTTYWNFANEQKYGSFHCVIKYPKDFMGYGKYRPKQSGQIHFRVNVNQTLNTVLDTQIFKGSTAVLLLPDKYSAYGTPTKLIMYCHGMSRNVTYTEWGLNDSSYLAQKERWRQSGYAIFDVNGQRDNGGKKINTCGSPQAVSAYRKAYEYIIEHYNIDPEIYIVGGSMGGSVALNYCFHYSNVRALALLSAWTDLYTCGWKHKVTDAFIEYYGFSSSSTYEVDKVQGWNPYSRILTINDVPYLPNMRLPICLWIGENESSSDLYSVAIPFMQALRNGGNDAITHIVPNAGHELVSGGAPSVDLQVAKWFEKF